MHVQIPALSRRKLSKTRSGLALLLFGFTTSLAMAGGEPDAAKLEKGKTVFLEEAVPSCAVCHALQDAGATGTIGPDLDATRPTYEQLRAALRDGVGVMPSFTDTLNEEALDAVSAYVVHATQK